MKDEYRFCLNCFLMVGLFVCKMKDKVTNFACSFDMTFARIKKDKRPIRIEIFYAGEALKSNCPSLK